MASPDSIARPGWPRRTAGRRRGWLRTSRLTGADLIVVGFLAISLLMSINHAHAAGGVVLTVAEKTWISGISGGGSDFSWNDPELTVPGQNVAEPMSVSQFATDAEKYQKTIELIATTDFGVRTASRVKDIRRKVYPNDPNAIVKNPKNKSLPAEAQNPLVHASFGNYLPSGGDGGQLTLTQEGAESWGSQQIFDYMAARAAAFAADAMNGYISNELDEWKTIKNRSIAALEKLIPKLHPPTAPATELSDPIHPIGGYFSEEWVDFESHGPGPSIELRRAYRSSNHAVSTLGKGWSHSYSDTLIIGAAYAPNEPCGDTKSLVDIHWIGLDASRQVFKSVPALVLGVNWDQANVNPNGFGAAGVGYFGPYSGNGDKTTNLYLKLPDSTGPLQVEIRTPHLDYVFEADPIDVTADEWARDRYRLVMIRDKDSRQLTIEWLPRSTAGKHRINRITDNQQRVLQFSYDLAGEYLAGLAYDGKMVSQYTVTADALATHISATGRIESYGYSSVSPSSATHDLVGGYVAMDFCTPVCDDFIASASCAGSPSAYALKQACKDVVCTANNCEDLCEAACGDELHCGATSLEEADIGACVGACSAGCDSGCSAYAQASQADCEANLQDVCETECSTHAKATCDAATEAWLLVPSPAVIMAQLEYDSAGAEWSFFEHIGVVVESISAGFVNIVGGIKGLLVDGVKCVAGQGCSLESTKLGVKSWFYVPCYMHAMGEGGFPGCNASKSCVESCVAALRPDGVSDLKNSLHATDGNLVTSGNPEGYFCSTLASDAGALWSFGAQVVGLTTILATEETVSGGGPDGGVVRLGVCEEQRLHDECEAGCTNDCEYECRVVACLRPCKSKCVSNCDGQGCSNACDSEVMQLKSSLPHCEKSCRETLLSASTVYNTYGNSSALVGNLVTIADSNDVVWLENTYGTDPQHPSYDKVVQQKLLVSTDGAGNNQYATITLDYVDLKRSLGNQDAQDFVAPFAETVAICPKVCGQGEDGTVFANSDVCSYGQGDPTTAEPAWATVFKDGEGGDWIYFGDDAGRIIKWVEPGSGRETNLVYETGTGPGRGKISGWETPAGVSTCVEYDEEGRVSSVTDVAAPIQGVPLAGEQRQVLLAWTDGNLLAARSVPNALDVEESYTWDILARLTSATRCWDATHCDTTIFSYDPSGRVATVALPSGATATYQYPAGPGDWTSLAWTGVAIPASTSVSRDALGRTTSVQGALGAVMTLTYDDENRTESMTSSVAGNTAEVTYLYSVDSREPLWISSNVGMVASLERSPSGSLKTLTLSADGNTRTSCFRFNNRFELAEAMDSGGARTAFFRDAAGRLQGTAQGAWADQPGDWDDPCVQAGGPHASQSLQETTSSYTFASSGLVATASKHGGSTVTAVRNAFGEVIEQSVQPCNGTDCSEAGGAFVRRFGRDDYGRVTWIAVYDNEPGAPPVPPYSATVPSCGDPELESLTVLQRDWAGRVTQRTQCWFKRDPFGQKVNLGLGSISEHWVYSEGGTSTSYTDPGGYTWTRKSDQFGSLMSLARPDGTKTQVEYGVLGGGLTATTTLVEASGVPQATAYHDYDAAGNLVSVRDSQSQVIRQFAYDAWGRLISATDGVGQLLFRYNGFGELTDKIVVGDDQVQTTVAAIMRDSLGRPTSVVGAGGDAYLTDYDPLGRVTTEGFAGASPTTHTYLAGSLRPSSSIDGNGSKTTRWFDASGAVANTWTDNVGNSLQAATGYSYLRGPLGVSVAKSYSFAAGIPLVTTTIARDSLGRIVEEVTDDGAARPVSFTHDAAGDIVRIQVEYDGTVRRMDYARDSVGRPTNVELDGSPVASYAYHGFFGPTEVEHANGLVDNWTYDWRGRRVSVTTSGYGDLEFVRDQNGLLAGMEASRSGLSPSATVVLRDPRRRVVAVGGGVDPTQLQSLSGPPDEATLDSLGPSPYVKFTYDSDDSPRTHWDDETSTGILTVVGGDHQLTDFGGAVSSDASGRTTSTVFEGHAYEYDGLGRMLRSVMPSPAPAAAAAQSGMWAEEFVYDAFGRVVSIGRRSAATPSAPLVYSTLRYAGRALVSQVSGSDERLYVPGPDAPVAAYEHNGQRYYAHAGYGSRIDSLSNDTAQLYEFFEYGPHGDVTVFGATGSKQDVSGALFDTFVDGQVYLPWSGLQRFGHRWLRPGIGRFLVPDPAGLVDGVNRYAFVGNQTFAFEDPSGLNKRGMQELGDYLGEACVGVFEGLKGAASGIPFVPVLTGDVGLWDYVAGAAGHMWESSHPFLYLLYIYDGVKSAANLGATGLEVAAGGPRDQFRAGTEVVAIAAMALGTEGISASLTTAMKGGFGGISKKLGFAPKGKPAFTHGNKYHPRVRARGVQDPKAHNFPYSFDDVILKQKPITQADGSLLYRKPGTLNGKDGFFEIALNPETKTIFHRTFVGKK